MRLLSYLCSRVTVSYMETIVNKVAQSGIITINLESYLPNNNDLLAFDLKPFLFMEMILKEKDFRAALPLHDWEQYRNKYVAVHCSTDAIIPMWAYMLIGTMLQPYAKELYYGTVTDLQNHILLQIIKSIDLAPFTDARVVIKGCGDVALPESAFLAISKQLMPVVKSLMYGEPCSTVPIYKRK